MFVENIFSGRYKYVDWLQKMGAHIRISERVAVVDGTDRLLPANVRATDLRGGAAVLLAALAAEGATTITDICHIDRGYDRIDHILNSLGADVKRVN
jgi:UDP-N-acetylglucosamine 1-carboxyvinyltransferase